MSFLPTGTADKSVGTDNGASSGSSYKLERAQRLQPFHYLPFNRKLNWKKIRALNLDRLTRESDSRTLMDLFSDVAQADLEGESSFNLTESNLIKLVKACQMMLQFVQHSSEQQQQMQHYQEEDADGLQALVKLAPTADLGGLAAGLKKLEGDYRGCADADLDAMFTAVRVEERLGAREILGGVVDQAKRALVLDAKGQRVKEAIGSVVLDQISRDQGTNPVQVNRSVARVVGGQVLSDLRQGEKDKVQVGRAVLGQLSGHDGQVDRSVAKAVGETVLNDLRLQRDASGYNT